MAATHTAGSIQGTTSMSSAQERWSGLHDDLLAMVLARLDSLLDRVRFAAVCRPWRAVAWTRPPRHRHPCLVLDPHDGGTTKHAYYPGDGAVLPLVTRLSETGGRRFVGCHAGGWVAHEAPLHITNVFSGAEVALPADQRGDFLTLKVIFSESPASRGCIIAAITDKDEVVIRGPDCGWTPRRFYAESVMDIAFCNGHLYCLMGKTKEVAKLGVRLDEHGVLVVGAVHWLAIQNQSFIQDWYFASEGDPDAHTICIVELRGKLAMAVRRTSTLWPRSRNILGPFFFLFELVAVDAGETTTQHLCKWVEVISMGDHALFLGPTCSMALHVPTCCERGGPRRNHIYYAHHRCYDQRARLPDSAKEFFTSSNNDGCRVYYKEDESVDNAAEGITSVGYYVCGAGHPTMWLFPPYL